MQKKRQPANGKEAVVMEKKWKYSLALTVGVFMASMGIFFLLYCFNNKYTAKGNQAIQGILYVKEGNASVSYLSGEWEYFPDLLLTPQELKEHKGKYYSRYLSVGEYGGMDLGDKNRSPFGSGTYRMTIVFPNEEKTYAIGLTEVFSAYKLYVNGELTGQVGNPDLQQYQEEIQNRVFTFKAKGTTQIMIAVTDRHSVSSGIQYVPVLGTPFQVNLLRGVTVLINALYVAFILFIFLFSGYMFLKTKKGELGFFCLLCICLLGFGSYPLLHAFVAAKVQPWYGLETLFYYLMLACMILVQQRILGDESRLPEIFAAIVATVSIGLFGAQILCSHMQNARGLYLLSDLTEILKWSTAAWLLAQTFRFLQQKYSHVLLTGMVVYAASLIADRIWKVYEPIVGGWFPETGGIVLVFCISLALWMELASAYRFQLTYGEYSRQMEQKFLMQKQHYDELTEKIDEISKMRHDMRHHLRTLMAYAQQGRYTELMEYLQEYAADAEEKESVICYCRNMAVDAVIHFYAGELGQRQISFEYDMMVPQKTGISDMDLCKIYGNLLENAVEAVKAQTPQEHPYVKVITRVKNKKLLIEISNTYRNKIIKKENSFYSTKHKGLGIGTASVREVVHKYGGYVDFDAGEQVFKVNIFLPVS